MILIMPGDDDKYSNEESQRRFEAALRGAREVGHEAMKDITPKRPKSATKSGKRDARAGVKATKKPSR
jgi:hypothetical protein